MSTAAKTKKPNQPEFYSFAAHKSGEFFPFCLDIACNIVEEGGGVLEVLAYLVMSRGAGAHDTTGWRVHGIAKSLGCTMSMADDAFHWLISMRHLESVRVRKADIPGSGHQEEDEGKGEGTELRVLVKREGEFPRYIHLPNALVDGIRGHESKPLARLLSNIKIDSASGVGAKEARLDAVMLLLELYDYQDLYQWGGVDPNIWHGRWKPSASTMLSARHEMSLPGIGSVFINEITREKPEPLKVTKEDDDELDFFSDFVHSTFSHVKEESQRLKRFELALANIRKAGLAYEVLQIWEGLPLHHDHGPGEGKSQIMYPLYVFDKAARESGREPALHRFINRKAVAEYSTIFGAENLYETDGSSSLIREDQFRYFSFPNQTLLPLSTLRLRFRPHNHDTGAGMQEQSNLVQAWIDQLTPVEKVEKAEKIDITVDDFLF